MSKEPDVKIGLEIHVELNTKTKLFSSCPREPMLNAWVADYLSKKEVEFDLIKHRPVTRPVDSAKVRKVSLAQIAKALVYMADGEPILFVLGGNRSLDKQKVQEMLNIGDLRMATPQEVKEHTHCVVGLVPPTIENIRKVIDERLVTQEIISFNAGDPRAGIKIKTNILLDLLDNKEIASISSDNLITKFPKPKYDPLDLVKEEPNARASAICLGMPGTKIVTNKAVVDKALRVVLAFHSEIAEELVFSRKSYFYPDMAKDYQITQHELPIGSGGYVSFFVDGEQQRVNLTRAHIEEDPASLVHPSGMRASSHVLVDYNRSGNPLLEIVTEPELHSPKQAREFLKKLKAMLIFLDVFDEGSIVKADANVSVKESNFTRAEIKNITGFKEIERALMHEIERQKQAVVDGTALIKETRGWDPDAGITYAMRSKENVEDYGYIVDTDLPVIPITSAYVERVKKDLPLLPDDVYAELIKVGVDPIDAQVISLDKPLSELYLAAEKDIKEKPLLAQWIRREVVKILNYHEISLDESNISAKQIKDLISLIEQKKITQKIAKELTQKIQDESIEVLAYVKEHNLEMLQDDDALEQMCKEVIAEQKQAVQDYLGGSEKALHYLSGQVMRKSKGKANPAQSVDLLKKLLEKQS